MSDPIQKISHRSKTTSFEQADDLANLIAPRETIFIYNSPTEEISPMLNDETLSKFVFRGKAYPDIKDDLKAAFEDIHSPIMNEFIKQIKNVFTASNAWEGISFYPPIILDPTEEVKIATYVIIDLLKSVKSKQAEEWIRWIAYSSDPVGVLSQPFKSSIIKACCLCHRKRKVFKDDKLFWAVIDANNHFTLYEILQEPSGAKLVVHTSAKVHKVELSKSHKTVKLFNDQNELVKRIIPVDPVQNDLWAKVLSPHHITRIPSFFTSISEPVPDHLFFALNEFLTHDPIAVRALTHFMVTKVSAGYDLVEALFDIYTYAGKPYDLLELMATNEFSVPELTHNTVLRGNSQLTNMFKVFFVRYGRKYYDDFLKRIVLYIDSKGDLHLKNPVEADSQKAQTMIFTVLRRIAGSLAHVPPEIRHFASVLEQAASIRFNSKQATYNTLSGFFCLRFVSAILCNPTETDPTIQLKNKWTDVMVPAAQLLMTPFNLIQLSGKYDVFSSWNTTLVQKIFPQLIDFVFSLAVCEKAPTYNVPSKERLKEALNTVCLKIGESQGKFAEKYNELTHENSGITATGCNFATFLCSHFKQNIH